MPLYRVTVMETTTHEFYVEAESAQQVRAMDTDEFADACSDNSGFVSVDERDIEDVEEVKVATGPVLMDLSTPTCPTCGHLWRQHGAPSGCMNLNPNPHIGFCQCKEHGPQLEAQ